MANKKSRKPLTSKEYEVLVQKLKLQNSKVITTAKESQSSNETLEKMLSHSKQQYRMLYRENAKLKQQNETLLHRLQSVQYETTKSQIQKYKHQISMLKDVNKQYHREHSQVKSQQFVILFFYL